MNKEVINEQLSTKEPVDRIQWARNQYGDKLVMSTSFGVQSAVMLHMATTVWPEIPVIFVDTGYLFPETYRFADQLTTRLNLNLKVYNPLMTASRQEALFGKRWTMGLEKLEEYNLQNKVEPMNRAVTEIGAEAWLAGLRRSQSTSRKDRPYIEQQKKMVKIYPILDWSDKDIYQYLTKHDLPYHPLWDDGYVTVGDWHSTSRLADGMTEEETRFNGLKRECGLHEISDNVDFQI